MSMSKSAQKKKKNHLIVLAVAIWVLSLVLAFVIAPGNFYIWLPDSLLLIGFWPLLFHLRAKWLWVVVGIFNCFIGFVLLVVQCMPDQDFGFDAKALAVKIHLAQYHAPYAWMLVGFITALLGLIILAAHGTQYLITRLKAK